MTMMRVLALSIFAAALLSCSSFSTKQSQSVFMLADELGGGTGFLVKAPSGKKYILTNAHVCISRPPINEDQHRPAPPVIVEVSQFTDLCLLEAPAYMTEALSVAKQEPKPFDKVYVIGYGLLLGNTLSEGHYVGRLKTSVLRVVFPGYSTNTILPGNSGSPVLNEQGLLVGVVFASGPVIANRTLMVSLEDIVNFLSIY